jgi:hypothetical protein
MYEHHPEWLDPWTGEYFTKDVEVVEDELTSKYGW